MSDDGYYSAKEASLESSKNEWLIVGSNRIDKQEELAIGRQRIKKLEALVAELNKTIQVLSDHIGKIPTEVLLMTSQQAKDKFIGLSTTSTQLTDDDKKRMELLQKKDLPFTLDEVEQYKQQALQRFQNDYEDTTREKQFYVWQNMFDKHPTTVAKQKAAAQAREKREASKRKEALHKIRAIIPRNIEELTKEQLVSMNMPAPLIRRIKKKSLRWLWLVWMPSATIAKLHIGDMRHQYAYSTKADITELRAVVECLPTDDEMESDPDGEKKEWANTFRKKLNELVIKEENGRLSKTEARDNAWKEVDEKEQLFVGKDRT